LIALATFGYADEVLRLRLKIKQDHTAWRERDGIRNTKTGVDYVRRKFT
jgi:hypothetical protein